MRIALAQALFCHAERAAALGERCAVVGHTLHRLAGLVVEEEAIALLGDIAFRLGVTDERQETWATCSHSGG